MGSFVKLAFVVAAAAISAPAAADSALSRMLKGESAIQGKKLEKALKKAEKYPLGSNENPVRAHMPPGQRAYLKRLRCEDGTPLQFRRQGNVGPGPYQNIVDKYQVRCGTDDSTAAFIYMDMYHKGYVEQRPVPGYSIVDTLRDAVLQIESVPEPAPADAT